MRITPAVALLPLASAFVIHDAEVFENIEKSGRRVISKSQQLFGNIEESAKHALEKSQQVFDKTHNALDDALNKATNGAKTTGDDVYSKIHETGCDIESWLEGSSFDDPFSAFADHPHHPDHPDHPHHPPPHHGEPPHHGPPHHDPHHKPHHGPSNLTVYELISKSNYTTKLAKLIDEYPDLVDKLNSTKANYTIFAPIDSAFDKIPKHHKKPSKEDIEKVLLYHITDDLYPAGRVLHTYTIPTLYTPSDPNLLGHAQRLTVRVTLRGPAINFYSRIIAVNIIGTNGIIHGISSLLVPPPNVGTIIPLLPGTFSTLELGLTKTGIFEKLNNTEELHSGGTIFAPTNFAFKKLGPRINGFLFSKYGLKYLKALLEYHISVDHTLYTDAYFDASEDDDSNAKTSYPYTHVDLPTVLDGKSLSIDVGRYGPFAEIRINGFSRVTVHDGVASDGVIQVVSDVLIPPKKPGSGYWAGEEMSLEEFKERLGPFVGENEEL